MTSNQDQITAFLAGKGLTAAQIAGVEGNLQIESGMSPTASNPKEGAIGIAQWEGGRRTALTNYAAKTGGTVTDLGTQLNYMWSELQGSESSALSALVAATTPAQAATAFDQKYERSSAASLGARVSAANNIAAGGVQGGSGNVQTGGGSSAGLGVQNAGFLGLPSLPSWSDLGRYAVDAFLVIGGAIALLMAVYMLSKSASSASSSPSAPSSPGAPSAAPKAKRTIRGDAEHVAEDGGEAAALA